MKKNVLKILLALVMVAMVFALVACGGGDEEKKTKPKDTKTQEDPKVDNVAALKGAITDVVGGVSPYFTALQEIKANSKVALDIGIGGYYDNTGDDPSEGNFKLSVNGNAQATDPELKVAFSLDDTKDGAGKDYLAIGYQNGFLYFVEPLSLINKEGAEPNAIKMDATLLKDGVNNVAEFGMGKLAGVVGGLSGIDLEGTVSGFITDSTLKMVAGLIEPDTKTNNKEIALVINSKNTGALIDIVGGLVEGWDGITGTIDSVLETAYDKLGLYVAGNTVGIDKEAAKEGTALKFDDVKTKFMPAIKIIGAFDKENTAEDKALNAVKIELNFEALKLAVGVSIDLKKLSVDSGKASVSFSGYNQKNLTSSIKVGLGQKNKYATLTATANTASAFKKVATGDVIDYTAQNVATASLKLDETNAVAARYDGESVYLDFTGFDAIAQAVQYAGFNQEGTKKFVQTFKFGDNAADFGKQEGDNFNIKYAAKYMLEQVGKPKAQPAVEENAVVMDEAPAALAVEGIWSIVYNMILDIKEGYSYDVKGADGKLYVANEETGHYDVVKDKAGADVTPAYKTADATAEDVMGLVGSISWVKKYLNVALTDDNGKGLSLEQVGKNFTEKFNTAKANFTGTDSAAQASGTKASVALFSSGKNLVSFVTTFINIPVLENGAFVKDNNDEYVVGQVTIDTAAKAQAYIEAIFALDDDVDTYDDWNAEIKTIFGIGDQGFTTDIFDITLGVSLEDLCANGVVLYAQYAKNEGLKGSIGIEDSAAHNYIDIEGSIGFVAAEGLVSTAGAGAETAIVADDELAPQIWEAVLTGLHYVFDMPAAPAVGE